MLPPVFPILTDPEHGFKSMECECGWTVMVIPEHVANLQEHMEEHWLAFHALKMKEELLIDIVTGEILVVHPT